MTKPPKARPCMLRLSGETTGRQQSDAIRRNQTKSGAIRLNQANQVQSGAIRCNQVQSGAIRLRQPAASKQSAIRAQSNTCRGRRNQTQSERMHSHLSGKTTVAA